MTEAVASSMQYISCQKCGHKSCIACESVWHLGVTCEDYQEQRKAVAERIARNEEEQAAAHYVAANAKNCPQCRAPGEKVSGCDHMTCPRCKYQYCWMCFANYDDIRSKGNTGHTEACRYHSNNLPRRPRATLEEVIEALINRRA